MQRIHSRPLITLLKFIKDGLPQIFDVLKLMGHCKDKRFEIFYDQKNLDMERRFMDQDIDRKFY